MKAIQEGDSAEKGNGSCNLCEDGSALTLESINKILVENPHNEEALKIMRKSTPARIAVGRCGARPKTSTLLNFLADHAAAQDAVFMDVSDDFLAKKQSVFRCRLL